MKFIHMILTSNYSESWERNVERKNLVFRQRKVKNFGMASAACVTSYRCLSTGVFKAGKFEKEFLVQFFPIEMYLYDINIKLFRIV